MRRTTAAIELLSAIRHALRRRPLAGERGFVLAESVVALALVGIVVLVALGGLSVHAISTRSADGNSTALELARSQLDSIKSQGYDSSGSYTTITGVPAGYTITISAPVVATDLQLITVNVARSGTTLLSVQMYKANL